MQTSPYKSSVSRDFVLLFVVMSGIIAVVSLWVAYKTFENYADGVVAEMESEAIRIDRSLIVEIKGASYLLESLARQVVQIGAQDQEQISRLLRSFNDDNNRRDEFSWLNASQEVIIYSGGGILPKPIEASDRDYVKKALAAPWQVHLGRPIKGRVSEKWVLPLSLGVTNYQGEFVGIIMMSIDIERLTQELSQITQKPYMTFSLYTRTLNLITDSHANDTLDYDDKRLFDLLTIDFNKDSKGLLSRPPLFKPSQSFGYYEASTQYPYIIYITYDLLASDGKVFTLMKERLLQMLGISVFMLVLLWMVRIRIIRPIEQLSDITAHISSGGTYTPLPKGGPIEIENLASQIRKLSCYITEQHRMEQELKLKNHGLGKSLHHARMLTKARSEFISHMTQAMSTSLTQAISELRANAHNAALKELDALALVMDDIRNIGQLTAHSITLHESQVHLPSALPRAVHRFEAYAHYRHVDVKLTIDDNLPRLLIDEEQFVHICVHLLCAAAASLPHAATIEMHMQSEHNEKGERALLLQLHYHPQSHEHMERAAPHSDQHAKSDITCFALARMLLSLYGADLSILNTDDTRRLFVRFPAQRTTWRNSR